MKAKIIFITVGFLFTISGLYAQTIKFDKKQLDTSLVSMTIEKLQGQETLKVIIDTTIKTFDQPTFVKVRNIDFKNGTIEVKVLSRLLKNSPDWARGFIGVTFRINGQNNKFEGIYVRPTNGRINDQLRRNRSIQYFSFPDFDFEQSRKEAPGKYESYADMGLDEWITMRIEVNGNHAELFLNNNKQPSLIVNDLKHGADNSGAIGLWVGNWTEGYFKDLKVWKK
jgi:hypothetical protein